MVGINVEKLQHH